MSANEQIGARFERLADLLEITGANPFRINALRRSARAIDASPLDLAGMILHDRASIIALAGMGEGTANRIEEIVRTGTMADLDTLSKQIPAGVPPLLDVPGLGPKKVRVLWQTAGIEDAATLKAKLLDGTVGALPGFGAKTVANILESLAFMERGIGRFCADVGWNAAQRFLALLRGAKEVERAEFAGSLRRGRDTVGDIDLLVSSSHPEQVCELFCADREIEKVLVRGDTKCSVRLKNGLQVDLRVLTGDHFGAAYLYFTGSKEHNVLLRERAQRRGMTLNEYGLYPDDGEGAPQTRGVQAIASATEESIYAALELPFIPAHLREEIGADPLGAPAPTLISMDSIRCELHAHTTASDGELSIEDLVLAAKARGFHTIAITDHSRSSGQANGLSIERLREHIAAIREVSSMISGIRILAGSEVDILADGSLDYPDDLLSELDIVVASPHTALRQDPETATKRLLRAVEHPAVDILGHPTGRMVRGRPGMDPDIAAIAQCAGRRGVALEINAHPSRLDLRDTHVRIALAAGAMIAINCDVHSEEHFDNLHFGVATARRGALTTDRCVNALDADALSGWLARPRG
ncbi:MAG: DNA polymerase/3'-5' exonuclease PolX [Planctomycetota bacterium]|nr:DNA polymerase/3'-5' exonuclease PolX [Planctomycetota bacterium]